MLRQIVLPALLVVAHIAFAQSALEVERVTITVSDLEISVPFYEEVLDFKKIRSYTLEGKGFQHLVGTDNPKLSATIVELQLGNETIAMQEFVNEAQSRPIPSDSKSNDLWFQHIAIFYEDLIGLKVMGHSENYSAEQEHLNQVFGARLWISGLRAKNGIGVEFLDYIAPPGGREYPADSSPTDLWHWHATIKVSDLNESYEDLKAKNTTFISKGIVTINKRQQFMIRDTDGHALLIIE